MSDKELVIKQMRKNTRYLDLDRVLDRLWLRLATVLSNLNSLTLKHCLVK